MHKYSEYSYDFFEKLPESLYERYLRKYYKETMSKVGRNVRLNLKQPKTFSEKIQWLKLNDSTKQKSDFTDKLKSKELVKSIIPEINVAKVYTSGKSFDELNFDLCPNKFILKTNHASAQSILINDKAKFLNSETPLGLSNTKKIVDFWLSRHFAFYAGFELHYKNIERKVYVEEYLDDIREYKFICCNGKPEVVIFVDDFSKTIYKSDWTNLCFDEVGINQEPLVKPKNFDKMFDFAKELSKDFKLVRVDLIESKGQIYFNEMTFTPSSGIIEDEKFDVFMGEKLKI